MKYIYMNIKKLIFLIRDNLGKYKISLDFFIYFVYLKKNCKLNFFRDIYFYKTNTLINFISGFLEKKKINFHKKIYFLEYKFIYN